MNEALLNFMDCDLTSAQGQQFAQEVLHFMRERLVDFQEETGQLFNLEATPAEGTSYRLAKLDRAAYPLIKQLVRAKVSITQTPPSCPSITLKICLRPSIFRTACRCFTREEPSFTLF